MTPAIVTAQKVLALKGKLKRAANFPVLLNINAWAKDNNLPPFFSVEDGFSPAYRIDAKGIGYEFSWRSFPGFVTFWLEHVPSARKACFGLSEDIEQPRPRKSN